MQAVMKLDQSAFDLFMKYKNKTVCYKLGNKRYWGKVVGIDNNYLLVKDSILTIGVLEKEIVYS